MALILNYIGFALLLVFGVAFYLVFKQAGSEQIKKYNATFSSQVKINIIGVCLILGTFMFSNIIISSIFFILCVIWIVTSTLSQRKKMILYKFDPYFTKSLFQIGFISDTGIVFLFLSKILGSQIAQ